MAEQNKEIVIDIRLSKDDKRYWVKQMQIFANNFNNDVEYVQFNKYDIEIKYQGRHEQIRFNDKLIMLGYVLASNDVNGLNSFNDFEKYYK